MSNKTDWSWRFATGKLKPGKYKEPRVTFLKIIVLNNQNWTKWLRCIIHIVLHTYLIPSKSK